MDGVGDDLLAVWLDGDAELHRGRVGLGVVGVGVGDLPVAPAEQVLRHADFDGLIFLTVGQVDFVGLVNHVVAELEVRLYARADQIERGYERIEERLNALGARITRVPARDS